MASSIPISRKWLLAGAGLTVCLVSLWLAYRWLGGSAQRSKNVLTWLKDPQSHSAWTIQAGGRCEQAPFLQPTTGFIGYLWGDSFQVFHPHQGLDIFAGTGIGQTPVVAVYDGYLTRQEDWKSAVIIRIPSDPLQPGRQIWTYYAHMADPQGNSFIDSSFPPGTHEVFVKAGSLLGLQGNYSGDPASPVGVHLHFSIVKDNGNGHYLNELKISNTLDPSAYLGISVTANKNRGEIPVCQANGGQNGILQR